MDAAQFLKACRGPAVPSTPAANADLLAAFQLARIYALGIDNRDEALVRSAFAPDATASGLIGASPIDEYIPKLLVGVAPYAATMHTILNQYGVIDVDRGSVWSYAVAYHLEPEGSDKDDLVIGLTYRDEVARRSDGWLITSRHTVPSWIRGTLPAS